MAEELTPKQIEFLRNYNDPKSETFSNALQSALKAGYSQEYSENIMSLFPNWLSENIGRRKRMLLKAEKRLETLIDSEDERVSADVSKHITKTLGRDDYAEKQIQEHKGKIVIDKIEYITPNETNINA